MTEKQESICCGIPYAVNMCCSHQLINKETLTFGKAG